MKSCIGEWGGIIFCFNCGTVIVRYANIQQVKIVSFINLKHCRLKRIKKTSGIKYTLKNVSNEYKLPPEIFTLALLG